MEYFVKERSIVRQIWGKSDTILFIFAGASAEFTLNKAVDWLYYTGRLPADPLGRLFSTVSYAQVIVFADQAAAIQTIDTMNAIHTSLESDRGMKIPDWAYRDVLFMLIDYSIRSYELLERPLTLPEKEEVFDVFLRVGVRMDLKDLPATYADWKKMRAHHLRNDLTVSDFTRDLLNQYRNHLGVVRYKLLIEVQKLLVPRKVKELLLFRSRSLLAPAIPLYKASRFLHLDSLVKSVLLPAQYKDQIKSLDRA